MSFPQDSCKLSLTSRMKALSTRFLRETAGQDLIEYALLAASIAVVVILAMRTVAAALNTEYTTIATSIRAS